MSGAPDDFLAFARLVDALRPWLGQLVIIGGWSHRLHRLHPWAAPPAYAAVRTRDADVAFSTDGRMAGDIGAALRMADFEEELSTDHTPPVSQYRLGGDADGFYAEFLAPLRGDGRRRDGTEDATVERAGVTAQKLRHVDLLMVRPWSVTLAPATGMSLHVPVEVRIANPVAFLAQKLLVRHLRSPRKQAQDALYVHDTLELFGARLDAFADEWRTHLRHALPVRTARSVEQLARQQFAAVTDVVREAARIPQDRTLGPGRLRDACAYGLGVIFGDGAR